MQKSVWKWGGRFQMTSYRDMAKSLMETPQGDQQAKDFELTYKKLYPLLLRDFAHSKDIEAFVEEAVGQVLSQMSLLSPLLTTLNRANVRLSGLGTEEGSRLLIKKNEKLKDGTLADSDIRVELDQNATTPKITLSS